MVFGGDVEMRFSPRVTLCMVWVKASGGCAFKALLHYREHQPAKVGYGKMGKDVQYEVDVLLLPARLVTRAPRGARAVPGPRLQCPVPPSVQAPGPQGMGARVLNGRGGLETR